MISYAMLAVDPPSGPIAQAVFNHRKKGCLLVHEPGEPGHLFRPGPSHAQGKQRRDLRWCQTCGNVKDVSGFGR